MIAARYKSHIVYESIYVKCPQQADPRGRKQIGGYQGLGAGGIGTEEYRVSLVGDEKVLELHRIAACTAL